MKSLEATLGILMTKKRDIYYEKYFHNYREEGWQDFASEHHELNIWLDDDAVTRDDLLKAGLVEGTEEEGDDDECDFNVDEDEELLVIPPLSIPITGDYGVEQEDLPEGVKLLPEDWREDVPELIGLKPEWIDGISFDG